MGTTNDPHGLLLQVIAHDLLSPLTAIKWQTELLGKPHLDASKRGEYLSNIEHSAALGIGLAKQAHVAARILSESYSGTVKPGKLSSTFEKSFAELRDQYARHGLSLTVELSESPADKEFDHELVSFYAWVLGKYFLTTTAAGNTVEVTGEIVESYGVQLYRLSIQAPNPEPARFADNFSHDAPTDSHDQTFVFSSLLRMVAPLLACTVTCSALSEKLGIDTHFSD